MVFAVYAKVPQLLEILIGRGHDVLQEESILSYEGISMLTIAIENSDEASVKLLLMHSISADKPIPCCEMMPVQVAARLGDWEIVKILVGAKPGGQPQGALLQLPHISTVKLNC